jgi:hypothetical protein
MKTWLPLVLAGCVTAELPPPSVAHNDAYPYAKPVERSYTYTLEPKVRTAMVQADLPTTPVDCQDQGVLKQFGQEHVTPTCIPGSSFELPEHEGCYWSLARGMDGTLYPPTRECHGARVQCEARLVRRVRADGIVEETREVCH